MWLLLTYTLALIFQVHFVVQSTKPFATFVSHQRKNTYVCISLTGRERRCKQRAFLRFPFIRENVNKSPSQSHYG